VVTPASSRGSKTVGRPGRYGRIARSPRGLFDDVQPKNSQRLLLAAITAFARHGFHGTTTREIAAIAGLSPAALYTHYPTKASLFYEISLVGHRYILELTKEALAGDDDPAEKISRLVRASVMYHAEEVTLTRVVNSEFRGALDRRSLKIILGMRHEISDRVRAVVEEGVAAGLFSVPDVHTATVAMLRLMDVSPWYNAAGLMNPEELADAFRSLILAMLGAELPYPSADRGRADATSSSEQDSKGDAA
jgi:AcrR family transcriptional regulator